MSLKALHTAVDQLSDIRDQLGSSFPPPHLVAMGARFVDRHEPRPRSKRLACYLKFVKVCSTLNAAPLLLDSAHVQEAYALGHIAMEQIQDIAVLIIPRAEDGQSASC
jgi:hypothetical protein